MPIAIVTGASSGLGRAYARALSREPEIREIWAVARREDRLRELEALCACPVRAIPLDLTDPDAPGRLQALLEAERPEVSALVCAAGFGKMGDTVAVSPRDNADMIDLNCRAAVAVTLACLPWMRQGGRILEICSTSAFSPMPGLNVYASTKAFLLQFTRTLRYELRKTGIHVTAVCPYWILDTEFIPTAQDGKQGSYRRFPLANRTEEVVERSLRASRLDRAVCTPGLVCTLHRAGAKLLPAALLTRAGDLLRRL